MDSRILSSHFFPKMQFVAFLFYGKRFQSVDSLPDIVPLFSQRVSKAFSPFALLAYCATEYKGGLTGVICTHTAIYKILEISIAPRARLTGTRQWARSGAHWTKDRGEYGQTLETLKAYILKNTKHKSLRVLLFVFS